MQKVGIWVPLKEEDPERTQHHHTHPLRQCLMKKAIMDNMELVQDPLHQSLMRKQGL